MFYFNIFPDPGLQLERQRVLVRQRLRGVFLGWDLDGPADQPAHGSGSDLRPAHDHAAAHHGPLRRPQKPRHLRAPDGVTQSSHHNQSSHSIIIIITETLM